MTSSGRVLLHYAGIMRAMFVLRVIVFPCLSVSLVKVGYLVSPCLFVFGLSLPIALLSAAF